MDGTVIKVNGQKMFGFIRGTDGREYFFHRDEFTGHFEDLINDYEDGKIIRVSFEPTESPKGKRANHVGRLDWPNQQGSER